MEVAPSQVWDPSNKRQDGSQWHGHTGMAAPRGRAGPLGYPPARGTGGSRARLPRRKGGLPPALGLLVSAGVLLSKYNPAADLQHLLVLGLWLGVAQGGEGLPPARRLWQGQRGVRMQNQPRI